MTLTFAAPVARPGIRIEPALRVIKFRKSRSRSRLEPPRLELETAIRERTGNRQVPTSKGGGDAFLEF